MCLGLPYSGDNLEKILRNILEYFGHQDVFGPLCEGRRHLVGGMRPRELNLRTTFLSKYKYTTIAFLSKYKYIKCK